MLDIFALFVRCSRIALESAAVVVAPRGRTPLLPPPPCGGARFPTLASPLSCAARASRLNPPPSSSLPEEERLCSLLLHAAARDSRRSHRPFPALLAHRAWNPPPSSSLPEEERLCSLLLHAAARDSRRSHRLCRPPVWLRSRAWVIRLHPTCSCFMRSGFSAWLTVLRWPDDLGWIPLSLKNCCSISRPAVGSNV